MFTAAISELERNTATLERAVFWLQVGVVALIVIALLFLVSIVSDLSTGQNERRDQKERER